MAIYIYETTSSPAGTLPERFEIQQGMTEKALTRHPETGQAIRRIVTGGFGYRKKHTGESIGSVGDFGPDP
jgi:predicted nucleic acid-binding Zn ribbon protein